MGSNIVLINFCFLICGLYFKTQVGAFDATWESLDTRVAPTWYDEAKFGIFLHWGVYSVPSFDTEWFWTNWVGGYQPIVDYVNANFPPNFTYQEFAKDFTAEFFDPDEWADLFQSAGARYVVITSKHHEGFTLWPSKYSFSWNAKDIGPHRDILAELSNSIRTRTDIHFGVYHSLFEWFNPLYEQDRANDYDTSDFVNDKVYPEMVELVETYLPDVIWSDGEWEAPDTYWRSTEFLAWLYNDSPVRDTVVVNDRWGVDTACHHGDFYNCQDRYNPGTLQEHKWENAMTIERVSWGYRRTARLDDYLTEEELIQQLTITVSCGGNLLLNVGPTKEGVITPIFEERLLNIGRWLQVNGEAIYESKPWTYQNDTVNPNVWYTYKPEDAVYAISLVWPTDGLLILQAAVTEFQDNTITTLLGTDVPLPWTILDNEVVIELPDREEVSTNWAWVIRIQNPEPRN